MEPIMIGRLLRANTSGCVFGCRINEMEQPGFGQMLRIQLSDHSLIYGLVHEIHVDDDGLVRQLVSSPNISQEVIEDNRSNRNMPAEISVVFIGWERQGQLSQTRPPRPPLSLDKIYTCSEEEVAAFCSHGHFAYLRAILRDQNLPAAVLVTAHLRQISQAGIELSNALREVIALMKDDYPQLMDVLSAVSEVVE